MSSAASNFSSSTFTWRLSIKRYEFSVWIMTRHVLWGSASRYTPSYDLGSKLEGFGSLRAYDAHPKTRNLLNLCVVPEKGWYGLVPVFGCFTRFRTKHNMFKHKRPQAMLKISLYQHCSFRFNHCAKDPFSNRVMLPCVRWRALLFNWITFPCMPSQNRTSSPSPYVPNGWIVTYIDQCTPTWFDRRRTSQITGFELQCATRFYLKHISCLEIWSFSMYLRRILEQLVMEHRQVLK